ncbi:signal peptidase I [Ralstonia pickettii]|nr:signal peptidase I [Ralstonia pickettii]
MGESQSIFKKTTRICIRIGLIALILLAALLAIQKVKYPNHPPSIFGYQPLTVLSNSMQPSFNAGDLLFVKKSQASEIRANDIITFHADKVGLVTHRVVDVVEQQGDIGFVTQGDNNNIEDEEIVTAAMLVGKQVGLIPKIGWISHLFSGKSGFIWLVLLPLAGYLYLEIYERIKKSGKQKPQQQKYGEET